MVETSQDSRTEKRFKLGAVIAALLSIPAVLLQTSENYPTKTIGNALNVFIWLFFASEFIVLVKFATKKWVWIKSHKLELIIVLGTAPVFSLVGEKGVILGVAPLLMIFRLLRILRFAKLLKVGKLLKTMKIIKKDESFPRWIDLVIFGLAYVLIAGLIGMIVNKEAHSITQGIKHWIELLDGDLKINKSFASLGIILFLVPVISSIVKVKKINKTS